jgi:hypothetical protein
LSDESIGVGQFELIEQWWNKQGHRWVNEDGWTNNEVFDFVAREELMPLIGRSVRSMFPGYGYCKNCNFPWSLVEDRSISLTDERGIFRLCESCWDYLRSHRKEDKIREFYREGLNESDVALVDAALDKEFEVLPKSLSIFGLSKGS